MRLLDNHLLSHLLRRQEFSNHGVLVRQDERLVQRTRRLHLHVIALQVDVLDESQGIRWGDGAVFSDRHAELEWIQQGHVLGVELKLDEQRIEMLDKQLEPKRRQWVAIRIRQAVTLEIDIGEDSRRNLRLGADGGQNADHNRNAEEKLSHDRFSCCSPATPSITETGARGGHIPVIDRRSVAGQHTTWDAGDQKERRLGTGQGVDGTAPPDLAGLRVLFSTLRQAPLARAVVVVILRIDLSHRRLPAALLVRVRDEAGQA